MATNPVGLGKEVVSASVPVALARLIEARAERMGWTKSKYASLLIQRWYDEGCPAVHPNEALLIEMEAKMAAEAPASYLAASKKKSPPKGGAGATPSVPPADLAS